MTEFKSHPIYNKYSANKDGDILGSRNKLLSPIQCKSDYIVLTVSKKQYRWHRFVWECHHGLIENKELVINHIDGNKRNNNLMNLELVTQSRNAFHAYELGLRVAPYGKNCGTSKLTNKECLALILLTKSGYSNTELGDFFGLHSRYISLIRHGRRWERLHKQYEELINSID